MIAAVLSLAALALPASAAAGQGKVPPGVSGAEQYTESLPGPGGNQPTGGGGDRTPAQVLGHRNAAQLEALGPEGRAAAQLAASSTPVPATAARGDKGGADAASGVSSSSPVGQVLGQVSGASGSGGMGPLLPLLLAVAALAAGGYVVARRRGAHGQHG